MTNAPKLFASSVLALLMSFSVDTTAQTYRSYLTQATGGSTDVPGPPGDTPGKKGHKGGKKGHKGGKKGKKGSGGTTTPPPK